MKQRTAIEGTAGQSTLVRSTIRGTVALAAVLVAWTACAQAQTRVPDFDARPGCRAGAASGVSVRPDVDACVQSEMKAKDDLARQWTSFNAADRERCVAKTRLGGPPSYIEVLTCVELAKAARDIPKDDNTGLATGLGRR